MNEGGKNFSDVTGSTGTGHLQKGHGIAFADIDNDGDQDIYASLGGGFYGDAFWNALFENPGNTGSVLYLILKGKNSNSSSIGAKIKLTIKDSLGIQRNIFREVNSGGSYGANPFRQEIGLGNAQKIVNVEISWPVSKMKINYSNLEPGKYYVITEGQLKAEEMMLKKTTFSSTGTKHSCH